MSDLLSNEFSEGWNLSQILAEEDHSQPHPLLGQGQFQDGGKQCSQM